MPRLQEASLRFSHRSKATLSPPADLPAFHWPALKALSLFDCLVPQWPLVVFPGCVALTKLRLVRCHCDLSQLIPLLAGSSSLHSLQLEHVLHDFRVSRTEAPFSLAPLLNLSELVIEASDVIADVGEFPANLTSLSCDAHTSGFESRHLQLPLLQHLGFVLSGPSTWSAVEPVVLAACKWPLDSYALCFHDEFGDAIEQLFAALVVHALPNFTASRITLAAPGIHKPARFSEMIQKLHKQRQRAGIGVRWRSL